MQEWQCVSEGSIYAYCSKEVAINGALGQVYSLAKKKPCVSDKVVAKGGTHAWYLGSIDSQKTVTFVYETKEAEVKSQVKSPLFSSTSSN